MPPANSPFSAGLPPLFRIGAKPLAPENWIEAGEWIGTYLDEKEKLRQERFGDVFAAEPDTAAAQAEVLQKLAAYLPARFPEIYRRDGDLVRILPAGRAVRLDNPDAPPLWRAAMLVPDDLLLMRKDGGTWRLAAGALCFPSSWRLREKFGRPMENIHAPVPDFGAGTRNAELIIRMFDNMRPEQPMIRGNWSLYGDDALYHPEESNPGPGKYSGGDPARIFLRRERQTLSKLPVSGDIVFTVGISVVPLSTLAGSEDGRAVARELAGHVASLDAEQLAYKGMALERDVVLEALAGLS